MDDFVEEPVCEPAEVKRRLLRILSRESGYFGRVLAYRESSGYQYIGFDLTEDIEPTILKMNAKKQASLMNMISYFEFHAQPLKSILLASERAKTLTRYFAELSWSQFSTVIMFGMLESVIKTEGMARLNRDGSIAEKKKEVKKFLEDNLSTNTKDDISKRYNDGKNKRGSLTFDQVIDHLYGEIRSGFIHDASFNSIGLEYYSTSGTGISEEDPITFTAEIPMQQWLQITWQAILNSYGYTGKLQHPPAKNEQP